MMMRPTVGMLEVENRRGGEVHIAVYECRHLTAHRVCAVSFCIVSVAGGERRDPSPHLGRKTWF